MTQIFWIGPQLGLNEALNRCFITLTFYYIRKSQNNKIRSCAYKKWRHTLQMTNDRPIHWLNYQWLASIHFICQYDFFFGHYKQISGKLQASLIMKVKQYKRVCLWCFNICCSDDLKLFADVMAPFMCHIYNIKLKFITSNFLSQGYDNYRKKKHFYH